MHDLVVLSDLHIGRGRNPETGRHHHLETFFFDEDLRRFFKHEAKESNARGTKLRVVFNGDTFDFLRAEPDAQSPELDARRAADLLAKQLLGHPRFVDALADLLEDGHEIVFLPGNHDLEIQWEPVQQSLRNAVESSLQQRGAMSDETLGRLRFAPWFHYEPGRIWIEHGCQYDPECAFRYPLRGHLKDESDPSLFELDLPLGNFFQRYLYNAFGAITFIVPSTRANARYSRFLMLNAPSLLLRVFASHIPFGFQVLRRLANKGEAPRRPLKEAHTAELFRLAREHGLGEKLLRLDAQKAVRGDLSQTVREYGKQALKFFAVGASTASIGAALWFSGFQAIQQVDGFGWKALLFLALNFFLMGAAVAGVVYSLVRQSPESPRPLRKGAETVASLTEVPIVTFGHSHDEMVGRFERPEGKTWYYNTGTWIAVFTHDVLLPRERVQYTFLRVRGHEAELLYWSPGRGEAVPVVLLDDGREGERPLVPASVATETNAA